MTVSELIEKTNLKNSSGRFLEIDSVPEGMRDIKLFKLRYLGRDVQALTTDKYLRSVDSLSTLGSLFQEEGLFCPFPLNYFRIME